MTFDQVKSEDVRNMQIWGRVYAQTRLQHPVLQAAFYLSAATKEERPLLESYFEEGVRNNATDQQHINDCMWTVRDWAKFYESWE